MGCCSRWEYQRSVAFTSYPLRTYRLTCGGRSIVGEKVAARTFSRDDRQRYREKLHACLDVFGRMLGESRFDFERPLTGMEIEFNLVDESHDPAMRNAEVLDAIASEVFQAEVGQFN